MKKLHPFLLIGFALNILYAIFLSCGWLSSFTANLGSSVGQGVATLLTGLIWLCIIFQALTLLAIRTLPSFALKLGLATALPFFPISLVYGWGVYYNYYDIQYAHYEKNLLPPKRYQTSYTFGSGNIYMFLTIGLLILGSASLFLPYFSAITLWGFAAICLLLAGQCAYTAYLMHRSAYIYITTDAFIFVPVPGKPFVTIPYAAIEAAQFTGTTVRLRVHTTLGTQKTNISLDAIPKEERTSAGILLRDMLQRMGKAPSIRS